MLAETALGVEQELVHAVTAEGGRQQRVDEPLVAQPGDGVVHERFVVGDRAAPALPQGDRAGIEARGQQLRAREAPRRLRVDAPAPRNRGHLVAHAVADFVIRHDLPVAREPRVRRQGGRGLQREKPVAVVRLEHDRVVVFRLAAGDLVGGAQPPRPGAPGEAVEIPQHRPAPVELARWGRAAFEKRAEGDRIGDRKLRQRARRHRVRQAGDARIRVLRHAPQRALHAREEHEQHGRDRDRMQQQQAGGAQVGGRCALRRTE